MGTHKKYENDTCTYLYLLLRELDEYKLNLKAYVLCIASYNQVPLYNVSKQYSFNLIHVGCSSLLVYPHSIKITIFANFWYLEELGILM